MIKIFDRIAVTLAALAVVTFGVAAVSSSPSTPASYSQSVTNGEDAV